MKKYSSTTRASLRRISRSERLKVTVWVAVAVLVVLVVAPRVISFGASLVLMPVVTAENWLRSSDATFAAYLRDRSELLAEKNELEQHVAELKAADHTTAVLEAENELLRSLLGASTTLSRIGAGVVGRPTDLPYDVLVIDKGSDDGVERDAPVYLGRDQVIGFIAEVYPRAAVVALVTTPGLRSTVYIYGPNIYTNAEGIGSGQLRVSVPQGIELSEGNQVVLPSFGTGIYGEVALVESVPTEPQQYGYVTIDEPLAGLRFVSVGREPLQPITFEEAKVVVSTLHTELTSIKVPEGILIEAQSSSATTTTESTPEL